MSSEPGSRYVAIVDDDHSVQQAVKDLLESAGLAAQCYASAEEFLELEQWHQTACLVLDIVMPGMSGLDLQAKLQSLGARLPIVFITAHGDGAMKTQALKAGALEVLSKPFDDEVLLGRVRAALRG